ncbi:MAG: hypothetical protein OSA06_06220 [Acidimicrobiales bacterium]|nr:hypothetical protein [Acidimicrobiales bacterium]
MKKQLRILAIILVAALSLSTGGSAHARPAIDTDSFVPDGIVIGDPGPDFPDVDLGSFDIELTSDFETHCDADDGTFTVSFMNNYTGEGFTAADRWVAISVEDNDGIGWAPSDGSTPSFGKFEEGDGFSFTPDALPGSYQATVTFYLSLREVDLPDAGALIDEMIADDEVFWQGTVSVDCSPDEPVETTEEVEEPVETTEEVEESEVDEAIEGSPLFTG